MSNIKYSTMIKNKTLDQYGVNVCKRLKSKKIKAGEKNKMESKKQDEIVQIDHLVIGEQESPKIDVSQYIGRTVILGKPVTKKGEFGFYIDVESKEVLDTIDDNIELKAKRRFGLKVNDEGKIYWTENMALGKFLKSKGLKTYQEMEGLSVKVQTRTDDNGQEWLTF